MSAEATSINLLSPVILSYAEETVQLNLVN